MKTRSGYIVACVLLLIMMSGCEVPFEPELDSAEPKVVIEAEVNNIDRPAAFVKLSRTAPYLDPDTKRPIRAATIVISSAEVSDTLHEVDTIPGYYISERIEGIVGEHYRLDVYVDGAHYWSESLMKENFRIDSINYSIEAPAWDRNTEQYVIWGYGQDPPQLGDLALFQLYRNDAQLLAVDGYMYVNDDKFTNGQYLAGPVGSFGFDAEGDTITLEVSSLTQETFEYIDQVIDLQSGIGGPFSAVPTNPVTNIEGGALGYFKVSSMSRDTVILGS